MENERVPLTREDVIRAVFIEAGGFDRKHGPDWKCPVLTRQ